MPTRTASFISRAPHPEELGEWYDKAHGAMKAVRTFCRYSRYTASVTIYTRDNRHVLSVKNITRP